MELKEFIYKRKSVRSYTGEPVNKETLDQILAFAKNARPLYDNIKVRAEIVDKKEVKCILPWITPQLIAIFSEDKEGALENAGFIFQQVDLYLQSLGLGACWLGMGKITPAVDNKVNDGMKFVILMTVGYPKGEGTRNSLNEFKRKSLGDISDQVDERLKPAQYAPSSVNSQPWYFVHDGNVIHVYCVLQGFLKMKMLGDMNLIDMGIALAHLYVANPDTFRFFKEKNVKEVKGYGYIGSICLD